MCGWGEGGGEGEHTVACTDLIYSTLPSNPYDKPKVYIKRCYFVRVYIRKCYLVKIKKIILSQDS